MNGRNPPSHLSTAIGALLLLAGALPAQSPGKPGRLAVSSAPAGANIVVNGAKMSQATDATFVVSPGTYKISVTGGPGKLNCPVKAAVVTAGSTVDLYCAESGWATKPK